jgi:hypothetical protein
MRHNAVAIVAFLLALASEPLVANQVAAAAPSKHVDPVQIEGIPDDYPEQVMRIDVSQVRSTLLALLPSGSALSSDFAGLALSPTDGRSTQEDFLTKLARHWRQGT